MKLSMKLSMKSSNNNKSYDIFISYRTTHRDWVETLARNLKAQGYSIFLDAWELIPGQRGQFEWRCKFIQETGKRLLAC